MSSFLNLTADSLWGNLPGMPDFLPVFAAIDTRAIWLPANIR